MRPRRTGPARHRLLAALAAVVAGTLPVTLLGPPALAEEIVDETLAPATAVYPKRYGYYRPVADPAGPAVPTVSAERLLDAAPGELDDEALDVAVGTVDALSGRLSDGVREATAYTTWEVGLVVEVVNAAGQPVYEDRTTYRYRHAERDGAISAVVPVPEQSFCKVYGGVRAAPYTVAVTECWYLTGLRGPDQFDFVTGSKFATAAGSVHLDTHSVNDGFVTRRDYSREFFHDIAVNGRECSVGDLPEGWRASCAGSYVTEL